MKRKPSTLREYLDANGITQAQFARRVGTTQAHVSRVLSGGRVPSLEMAIRIAREAGIPVESLIEVPQGGGA